MNPKHADVQRRFSVAHDKTSRRYSVAISAASARPSRLGLNVVGRSGTGSVTGTRGGAHLRSSNSSNLISARNIDKGTPGSAGNTGRQHPRNRNMRQERVSTASSAASLSPLSKPRSGSQRSRPTRRLTNKATFRRRLPGWKGYQARKNAELAQAVKVGDIERAKRLLREGADINATERGNHNRSLVHASVQFLQDDHQLCSEVVDELADLGADCTCVDDIGNSPLHLACSLGNLPAAEVLLNQNLSPVQTNKQGSTPLQLAVENGNASMVRLLLTHQGSQSAVRTLFTTPQDHMHTRMRSDVYRSALDSNATAVLAELVQFHTRVGGVSFDDIATSWQREFTSVPFLPRIIEHVRDSLPSSRLRGSLTALRTSLSTSSLGTARGRLLSVARKRSLSGDKLRMDTRARRNSSDTDTLMDATSSPSPTSLTSPTSTAAAAAAAATTTAALSSSSPRKWLGPRVVRVERGEGGRFNFDVSGGAESLMLPRVILHHAGAAPNYVTHERLNTGDEIVAVDNIQVAGMSHDAVVRVLKAAKETVTLTVLPIDQRTAFQCNDNAQQEGTGKIFKAQSSSAFRTLDSDVPITTRPPLSDEVDGKDYHFVSVALFQYLLTHKHVREWGQLKSHFYGALKTTLEVSPVRSLSNVDLIATTIKSRCGRLKVAHVQRNANGVFGFTIGGGAGVGELPFVDRVCDVKIANPDKASILPNDAILAIDGVTVAAETSGAVTELITAGGNIVKLLLLTHSFDGVRERGASGDDRSTTNSFRAHAPPAMSNTYAASASSSSATSSATTGITSSSAAAAAMMARGQRVQATSSSSSSSIAATSATTTPAASAAADADAQNQNAHSAGGVLNAFAPPGVGDFGVKQVAAEMEGTLRKASGEAVGGGDGGERVKGDGVKGELVLTNGDIKTAEMMALEQHSGKEEGKKEEDTKTEEVEEDTETGTSATAAETSAPTADDGGDGDVSKARDVKNGMGDGQDEAADTTQKTENTMGQNMSEPSTAPTAAANAEEAEKEEDATGDGDGDGDGGAQWNSDVVSVDPFAAVDDTDTKASATTTTTTVAGGGKQDIVRDESPVTKRSRTTTAASSGGDDDDDDDDGEYVQIIAGDEDDDDDDNTKKEEEEAEKRVPVNIEPAMHASIMKLSKDHALADEFVALSRVGVSSTSEHSAKNRSKNRYRNITAYDHTRVVLDILEGDDDCDYYNANFIPSDSSAQSYIACQGPTPPSMEDFWRMVWQKDVSVIVMVTKETELGRIKCHRYWPTLAATEAGRPLEMGYYTVKCTAENVTFLLTDRTFELERYGEPIRTVRQVHYHSWPDHGIPQHLSDLLLFREYVRGVHASMGHRGPLLVHCSAGVGRSGTFIAIDRIMRRLEVMPRHEPVTKETVDLNKIVHEMRTCRNLMVQTTEQYIFLHKLITHLLAQCREVDALDVSSHLQSQFEQRQLEFENAYDSLESYSDDSDDDGK